MKKLLSVFIPIIFLLVNANQVFAQIGSESIWTVRYGSSPGGNIPPTPSNIAAEISRTFNVNLSGFDQTHLAWLWELLWETSNTKFPDLLRGMSVQAGSGNISYQRACNSGLNDVILAQYNGRQFFKFIATHEFSHYIQVCRPRVETGYNEIRNARDQEDAVSWYGQNAETCFSDVNSYNENHADAFSYYLHRTAGFSSGPRSCVPSSFHNPPNPFYGSGGNTRPLQFNVIHSVLSK